MPNVKASALYKIIQHFADRGELDYAKKMLGAIFFFSPAGLTELTR